MLNLAWFLCFSWWVQAPTQSEPARARYEELIEDLRDARSLDFSADVVVTRYRGGVSTRTDGRLEIAFAKGECGYLKRERFAPDGGVSAPSEDTPRVSENVATVIEILADGDVAYQVDRAANAYVKLWPPRFMAGGEGRSILPLRVFLGEALDEPIEVAFRAHPKQKELEGLEIRFHGRTETAYFDIEGALHSWVRVDEIDGMRSTFVLREYRIGRTDVRASYARRPADDLADATARFGRGMSPRFVRPDFSAITAAAGAIPPAARSLVPGARDVDAAFLDATGALTRLGALRGRFVVLVFLDANAPQCEDAVRRLRRLAVEALERGIRAQFVGVVNDDPPRNRREDASNLRFVRPLHAETERFFGVMYHPTTFVLDREGVVLSRSSIGFDEAVVRTLLGL